MIYSEGIFGYGMMIESKLTFLHIFLIQLFLYILLRKILFAPICHCNLLENQLTLYMWLYFCTLYSSTDLFVRLCSVFLVLFLFFAFHFNKKILDFLKISSNHWKNHYWRSINHNWRNFC